MDRASQIDKQTRIFSVAKAILQGYTKTQFLLHYISETYGNWGVSQRQVENYIRSAKNIIKNKYSSEDLEIEKDIALSRLESLFTMNMKIQDYRECRNVTIDRMKLLGMYIDKKDVTSGGEKIVQTPLFGQIECLLNAKANNGN